ncbi:MAG: 16S rRNA (cytidine(1402)-2'-O)-methyltransferase, partial [Clostridia bacterium]|nr:16S rRNA (cytidine(1402)-2'-O)-methyltransferase [Clostridia bacterium]
LGERKAVLVNEITKMYEKTYEFTLCKNLNYAPKGEYVLVVEGLKQNEETDFENLTIAQHLNYYISLGESKNDAIKKVAKERGLSKNEVYQVAINL